MDEIPNVLETGEKVIWSGKPRYAPYIFHYVITGLILSFFAFFFALWATVPVFILALVVGTLYYRVTHYAITNKRAVFQSGIIGRDFKFVDYDKMQNVSVDVGIIDKLFGTGSIRIFSGEIGSRHTSGPTIVSGGTTTSGGYEPTPLYDNLSHVPNPYETLRVLQGNLSKRKEASLNVLKSIEQILKRKL